MSAAAALRLGRRPRRIDLTASAAEQHLQQQQQQRRDRAGRRMPARLVLVAYVGSQVCRGRQQKYRQQRLTCLNTVDCLVGCPMGARRQWHPLNMLTSLRGKPAGLEVCTPVVKPACDYVVYSCDQNTAVVGCKKHGIGECWSCSYHHSL